MNNNVSDKTYIPLTPFKGWVLENFPFIEADFDAITNYQLYCKIVEYLNNVISNQNQVQELGTELVTAYNQLLDYVNNYFDNLDIQEEINNKLDKMAEDGSLELIISPLIDDKLDNINAEIESNYNTLNTRINNIQTELTASVNKNPIPVSSTSDMTDTSKIYVLTTDGNWYYYNGTTWVSGGTYQSTSIGDDTISSNMLTSNLRNGIGILDYILECQANHTTVKNLEFKLENNETYEYNIVVSDTQYINRTTVIVTTRETENGDTIDTILSKNSNGTYTGKFVPSADANYINIDVKTYTAGTVTIYIKKLINYNELSNEAKNRLGALSIYDVTHNSNYKNTNYYPLEIIRNHKYIIEFNSTNITYVASPTVLIQTTLDQSTDNIVDEVLRLTTGGEKNETVIFTASGNANYLSVYVQDYNSGSFSTSIKDITYNYEPISIVSKYDGYYNSTISSYISNSNNIQVYPGTYDENIGTRSSLLPEIIGVSKNSVIITDDSGNYATPPLQGAKVNLSNLTITETGTPTAETGAYCIHIDNSNGADTKSIIENCYFENPYYWCIGIGTFENQEIIFRNCEFTNNLRSIYMHNGGGNYQGLAKVKFINCIFRSTNECLCLQDFNGNGAVEFTFINCNLYSENDTPILIEYRNYSDSETNKWDHKFSLSNDSSGNNIDLLNK